MPRFRKYYYSRSAKFPEWQREEFKQIQGHSVNAIPSFYDELGFTLQAAQRIIDYWNAQASLTSMRVMGYEYRLDLPEDKAES